MRESASVVDNVSLLLLFQYVILTDSTCLLVRLWYLIVGNKALHCRDHENIRLWSAPAVFPLGLLHSKMVKQFL